MYAFERVQMRNGAFISVYIQDGVYPQSTKLLQRFVSFIFQEVSPQFCLICVAFVTASRLQP